jgi:hypothetical protein
VLARYNTFIDYILFFMYMKNSYVTFVDYNVFFMYMNSSVTDSKYVLHMFYAYYVADVKLSCIFILFLPLHHLSTKQYGYMVHHVDK